MISTIGSYVMGLAVLVFVGAVVKSLNGRRAGNDPWRADTLEWSTSSPTFSKPRSAWREPR